jgi:hypothetical protein
MTSYLDERNASAYARWAYARRMGVICADPLPVYQRAAAQRSYAPKYTAALKFLARRAVLRGRHIVLPFRRSRAHI